jgi:putative spermidine/putrescine transport system permease protein
MTLLHGFGVLVLAFLAVPIIVLVPLSFSSSLRMVLPPPGWSMRWYEQLLHSERWINAASFSVQSALIATALSVALGLAASLALTRGRLRHAGLFYFLVMSPLVVPHLVTGIAIFLVLNSLAVQVTALVVGAVHVLVCLPPFVMIVTAAMQGFDQRLEQAAVSLGASPFTTFRRVTLPLLAPAVVSGAIIAFLISFDELTISLMIIGTARQTLPVVIWSSLIVELNPIVTAISSILIAFTIAALALSSLAGRANARRHRAVPDVSDQ